MTGSPSSAPDGRPVLTDDARAAAVIAAWRG
jgi:hypothetical protein